MVPGQQDPVAGDQTFDCLVELWIACRLLVEIADPELADLGLLVAVFPQLLVFKILGDLKAGEFPGIPASPGTSSGLSPANAVFDTSEYTSPASPLTTTSNSVPISGIFLSLYNRHQPVGCLRDVRVVALCSRAAVAVAGGRHGCRRRIGTIGTFILGIIGLCITRGLGLALPSSVSITSLRPFLTAGLVLLL